MNPHAQHPPRRSGARAADAAGAVIAVHGRNQSPDVAEAIVARLGWPNVCVVAPQADGGTWYPERFLAPIASNQPALDHALAAYDGWIEALVADGIPRERIVLLGFSQGACLTAEYALRRPARYGALLLFTGGAIGEPGTVWPDAGSLEGTPAYLGTSDVDEWVPLSRVQETAALLALRGALVTQRVVRGRAHEVSDVEIADARVIGPFGRRS